MIRAILDLFIIRDKPLSELAIGLCVLPLPVVREKAQKRSVADVYVIDDVTKTFGFNIATAQRQQPGGTPEITAWDKSLLKERGYWGQSSAVKAQNIKCKAMWHTGRTEAEAAASLGLGQSWVEKRYGTFATALLQEQKEGPV